MERFGTAWEKIEVEMAKGYPEPSFEGDGPVFVATIWPHPAFAGSRVLPRQRGGVSGGVKGLGGGEMARRREAILEELSSVGAVSARELGERLKISSRTLERDLAGLLAAGLIVREGPPRPVSTGWLAQSRSRRHEYSSRQSRHEPSGPSLVASRHGPGPCSCR